jgi:hypothetical protein
MPTVFEGCTTEEQRSIVRSLWTVGLSEKDIHTVCDAKRLLCKTVNNWVEKSSEGRSIAAHDAVSSAEVAETTVKRLLCCWF